MKRISLDKVIHLHQKMICATGGESGLRDRGLLESSLNNAYITFDGIDLYPNIEDKCANVCYTIIKNHPFIDGNKRMGIYIMLILLEFNGYKLVYSQRDLIELGLGLADGTISQTDVLCWINDHRV